MTFPKARVVVSGLLFLGWLGFLLYLVCESRTMILSKPQFMIAQLIVVADIGGGQANEPRSIVIDEVLWPIDAVEKSLLTKPIRISGAAEWRPEHGYVGPGKYLLPLMRGGPGSFLVAPLPRTAQTPEIRIYPWTPELRGQVEEIIKSRDQ